MKYDVKENKVYKIINSQLLNHKLSHAYLIETNGYQYADQVIVEIEKLLLNAESDQQIAMFIENDNYAELEIIRPVGNMIKKEQLLKIKEHFKTKSLNQNRVYVIYEADKLNSAAANTILKFLEEPEPNIIALLITNNRYQVLPTIVSRCQLLSFHCFEETTVFDDKVLTFAKKILHRPTFYLEYKTILEEYLPDKYIAQEFLLNLELLFHQALMFSDFEKELFANIENVSIIKYIAIIEEEKDKLNYNINYKLWLDHLLIRFMEVKI